MRYLKPPSRPRQGSYYYDQYQAQRLRRKKLVTKIATISAIAIVAVIIVNNLNNKQDADAQSTPNQSTTKTTTAKAKTPIPPPTPALASDKVSAMQQAINGVIAKYPNLDVSASIIDIKTGTAYNYGFNGQFFAASENKLVAATLLLHMVDQGKLTLNSSISGQNAGVLLTRLIEQSDNDAWDTINTYVGYSQQDQWAAANGWTTFKFYGNLNSSADIAKLLSSLYQNKLLSASSTKVLLDHMAVANEDNHILQYVPDGVKVYHKAGWLDDYMHDSAIIDNGTRPYVLAVFIKGDNIYNSGGSAPLYRDITNATLTAFGVTN